MAETKNIMVYVETVDGAPVNAALEILAKAKELAGARSEEVIGVVIGSDQNAAAQTAIEAGADKVIVVEKEDKSAETQAAVLVKLVEAQQPSLILAAATLPGKDITALVAGKLQAGCAVDVLNIQETDGKFVMTCPVYGGTVLNDIVINTSPAIASVRSGAFSKNIETGKTGEIVTEAIETEAPKTTLMDTVKEIAEAVNLEEADVIVAGGRGMGSKENFELVKELADVCGGVVGATRPAIEDEWIPRSHQVGQSGKIVAPKLYIACGISGATQHVSGMVGSDYIVAINKDEDAPIFDIADVGIVGDAVKVIPIMIDAIKKIKE